MLENQYQYEFREAGCDEAGRGCLAGPVFAAAVILPPDFHDPLLNDSKQMTERNRDRLRLIIEREAVAWAVEAVSAARIDEINILNASFEGMSLAVARLDPPPEFLAIDGNRFRTRLELPYRCVVKGDGKYADIAAASVLAKPIGTSTCCASRRNIRSTAGKRTRGTRPASIGSQSGNTDLRPTTVCRSVTGSASWSCNSERGLSFRVLPGNPVVIGYDHLPRLNPRPEFTLPSCSGGHTFEDAGGRITIGMAHKKGLKSDFSPFSI